MKQRKFGIQSKSLLLLAGVLATIFGGLAYIFAQTTIHSLRQSLQSEAQTFAVLATQPIGKTFLLYKDSGTYRIDQQVTNFTQLNSKITNVVVLDLDGKAVYKQHNVPMPSVSASQAGSFNLEYISDSGGNLLGVVEPFIEDSGVHRYGILYTISSSQIQQSVREGTVAILVFALVTLLLTAFVLFVTINQVFLGPIRRLSEDALDVSAGNLNKQIASGRHDEIGALASSVNSMADTLKADIIKLREVDELKSEFMMITSHNLRTPLSIINGYLETLKSMKLSKEAEKMVETITANSARLGTLAEDILTISQIEAGQQISATAEVLPLAKITDEIAKEYETLATKRQLTFGYKAPKSPPLVKAGTPQLRQAIWNLLDNAMKFTKPGGQVGLVVRQDNDNAFIEVTDTGIGISPEEVPKLFTKFHRGTSTLQYDYEGTGIGLYISRLVVREFNGDITVQSQLGKGSTFTITLPLAPSKDSGQPLTE